MNDFDRLFETLARFNNPSYEIGFANTRFISNDTSEVPRYVENPEWRIKNMEEQIDILDKRDEYFDAQVDRIIAEKDKLKEQKKELKKELKKLRNSD